MGMAGRNDYLKCEMLGWGHWGGFYDFLGILIF